jgi:hypothetical protein
MWVKRFLEIVVFPDFGFSEGMHNFKYKTAVWTIGPDHWMLVKTCKFSSLVFSG